MDRAAERASGWAINRAAEGGVLARTTRSFGNNVDSTNRYRIDIDIVRGRLKQIVE
jgi:hypothetical protein